VPNSALTSEFRPDLFLIFSLEQGKID